MDRECKKHVKGGAPERDSLPDEAKFNQADK